MKVKEKQFKDRSGHPVTGMTPEHAVYDQNGVRLDEKLAGMDLAKIREAQARSVEAVKEQEQESVGKVREVLEHAEEERQGIFEGNEEERQRKFDEAEAERQLHEDGRVLAERKRVEDFDASQAERQREFDASQAEREETFDSKEAERDAAVKEAREIAGRVGENERKLSELEGKLKEETVEFTTIADGKLRSFDIFIPKGVACVITKLSGKHSDAGIQFVFMNGNETVFDTGIKYSSIGKEYTFDKDVTSINTKQYSYSSAVDCVFQITNAVSLGIQGTKRDVANNINAIISLNDTFAKACITPLDIPSKERSITSSGTWGTNKNSTHKKIDANAGYSIYFLAGENEAAVYACSDYAPSNSGVDASILESYIIPPKQGLVITAPEGAICLVVNCLIYSGTTLLRDSTPKVIGINTIKKNEDDIAGINNTLPKEIEAINKMFINAIDLQELPLMKYTVLSSLKYASNSLSNRNEVDVKGGDYIVVKANKLNSSTIAWLQKSDNPAKYGTEASVSVEPSYIVNNGELEELGAFVTIEADTTVTLVAPKDATVMVVNITSASGQETTDKTPQSIGFYINNIADIIDKDKVKTDIVSLNGKAFLDTMFAASKRATRINSVMNEEPLSLLWFSDIHGDGENLKRVVELYTNYEKYIDDMIHCGDSVYSYYQNGMAFWDNVEGAEKILNVIGNHECRDLVEGGGWSEYDENDVLHHSEQDVFDAYFGKYIENWGVNYINGKCYYYKDYEGHNGTVRLIVLDSMRMTNYANPDDDAQIVWLKQRLEESITNGYHVVIAKHFFNGGEIPIKSTFTSLTAKDARTRYHSQGKERSYNLCPIIQPYIDRGLNFVCYLNGHVHSDVITVHPEYPKQMSLAVTTGNATTQHSSFHPRAIGERSQDDFNIIIFETTTKRIKIFKVGCDHDIYLRKIESCVINYETGEVEYSN